MTPRGPSRDPLVGEGSPIPTSQTVKRGRIAPEGEHYARSQDVVRDWRCPMRYRRMVLGRQSRDLPEFFRSCDPSYAPTSTGWFLFGPYTTEGAARRELREFVDEFFRDAATDHPTLH